MNYYIRNNLADYNRWFRRIVPFAMAELKQFGLGRSVLIFRDEYEDALKVKHQLCSIKFLLDSRHLEYLERTILSKTPSSEPESIERELYMDIYEVWRSVCFPKSKSQIKTIRPAILGGLLRGERIRHGIPANHAAELIGISEKTLYNYEEGTRMMRVDVFYKLCQIYKAFPEQILNKASGMA